MQSWRGAYNLGNEGRKVIGHRSWRRLLGLEALISSAEQLLSDLQKTVGACDNRRARKPRCPRPVGLDWGSRYLLSVQSSDLAEIRLRVPGGALVLVAADQLGGQLGADLACREERVIERFG